MTEPSSGDTLSNLDARSVKVYAEFGRSRGGLLYILQAVVVSLELVITQAIGANYSWWAPVFLMPLYVGYLLVRDPIWVRLYRPHGNLELSQDRQRARFGVWWSLAMIAITEAGWYSRAVEPSHPGATVAMLAWLAVFWLLMAVRGRLPVDTMVFVPVWVCVSMVLGGRNVTNVAGNILWARINYAVCLGLAVWGVYEHRLFRKAMRQEAPRQ